MDGLTWLLLSDNGFESVATTHLLMKMGWTSLSICEATYKNLAKNKEVFSIQMVSENVQELHFSSLTKFFVPMVP